MRRRNLAIATTGVLLAIGGGATWQDHSQHEDTREAIRLPEMQRNMVLAEMRGLLTSVNGILRGLASRDTALMRQSAANAGMAAMMAGEGMGRMGGGRGMRGGGMGMGAGRGQGPMMPEGFRTLGHATHMAFDSLASRIAAGASADTVIARLAALTNNCLSCHSTYRIEVVR